MEQLPLQEWLIDGVLPKGGSAVLFGESGTGKTFTALDWSFHIGLGRPWLGRAVKQGDVVYVAGEGGSGYRDRVIAWSPSHYQC
jgi:RecA-family ATPase